MLRKVENLDIGQLMRVKLSDYDQLIKLRLNLTVVFSAAFGYMMVVGANVNGLALLMLSLGGFFVTSSANAINQILEKDYDKMMKRTANRPLSTGRMEMTEAILIAGLSGVSGLLILWYFLNPLTALLGAISLILYAFVYTPLKRYSPIAVFVGAIPGALPVLIGWIGATGSEGMNYIAFSIFCVQFLWQFPHFWSIGWLGYEDYKKAGFKLLPTAYDGRNINTAIQILIYTMATIFVSFLPFVYGITGILYLVVALMLGLLFVVRSIQLIRKCDNESAKKVMFASLIYLPVLQIVMVLDKIF